MFRRAGMGGTVIPELLGLSFIVLLFWFTFICIRDGFKLIAQHFIVLYKWLTAKSKPKETKEEWLKKQWNLYPASDLLKWEIEDYMETQEVEDIIASLKGWGMTREEIATLIRQSLLEPNLKVGAKVEDRIKYLIRNKSKWS
jgi:hypothetical protein